MRHSFKTSLAAFVVAILPMMSSAAVVSDITFDQGYHFSDVIGVGQSGTTFTFTPTGPLTISSFSLAGFGFSSGADLSKVTYTINNPSTAGTFAITTFPGLPFALGLASSLGGSYSTNDIFILTFAMSSPAALPVAINVAFDTAAAPVPAAVPVPAAGLMLLTALGGAAALRRRKKANVA